MLKKSITYTDYNDVERTEDFYFNLTKVELTELEASVDGGMAEMLQRISASGTMKEMLGVFRQIISISVGLKSEDGRRFIKSDEIAENFLLSPAFDELFMSIATDAAASAEFLKAIMPKDLSSKIDENSILEAAKSLTNTENEVV